jgi:hypothetical protein
MPPSRGLTGIPRGPLGLSLVTMPRGPSLPLPDDSQEIAAQMSDRRGLLVADLGSELRLSGATAARAIPLLAL